MSGAPRPTQPSGLGADVVGAAIGARLRARELSAAPDALNLLESTAPDDREQAARAAGGGLPRRARRRGSGAHRRRHRTARRRQVDAALGPAARLARRWRQQGDGRHGRRWRYSPSIPARAGRAARCSATARASTSTPPTRACSSARPPPASQLGGLASATRAAAQALAAAFDVVVIETVGVGQAETDVADVADTVAVVVQPGSGDVLQFLKSGIMEIPDVLVVTKADLGADRRAHQARPDRGAALARVALDQGDRRVLAASAAGRRGARRGAGRAPGRPRPRRAPACAARRASALADYAREHGERGLSALGGRRAAQAMLDEAGPRSGRALARERA